MRDIEFIFDLDDTLYRERDYSRSALAFVGKMAELLFHITDATEQLLDSFETGDTNPIDTLWGKKYLPHSAKEDVIAAMRGHAPSIKLDEGANDILSYLRQTGRGFSIVTDGRSITQRAKLAALGCLDAKLVSISHEVGLAKTDPQRFLCIEQNFYAEKFIYVGDNPLKDFVAPNKLGWSTIMLKDDGTHIHKQVDRVQAGYEAKFTIANLNELREFL